MEAERPSRPNDKNPLEALTWYRDEAELLAKEAEGTLQRIDHRLKRWLRSPKAGYILQAVTVGVLVCLRLWLHTVYPGIAVAILGVAAALMTIRGKMGHREQMIWVSIVFALLFVELKSIREERERQESEFKTTLNELRDLNTSNQAVSGQISKVSIDLSDVKTKVEIFRANAPKDLTSKQVTSIIEAYKSSRAEGGSDQTIEPSTDRLLATGSDILGRLDEAIKEYDKVYTKEEMDAKRPASDRDLQFNSQQWLLDFKSYNNKLFVDANYLRDVILIKLGRDVLGQRWFDIPNPSSGGLFSLRWQTAQLQSLLEELRKLPRRL